MEWHIMNVGGVSSLGSNLGCLEDSQYIPSDECKDVLSEIMRQLKEEDPQLRNVRRQIYYSHLVEKDLCVMLKYLRDDPEIFSWVVRILANLTLPVESLIHSTGYTMAEATQTGLSWQQGVESSLHHYRKLFTDKLVISSLLEEVHTLVVESEGYPLSEESCDVINQVLLLLRNLLHFPSNAEDNSCKEHEVFLRILFECDFTERLIKLLQLIQREYWTVTAVQLVTLIFKGHTGEMFLQNVTDIESVTFIIEQSEDSQECLMCGYQHSDKDFQCINYLEESISKNLRLRQGSSEHSSPNSSSTDLTNQEQEKLHKYLEVFAVQFLTKAFCNMVHDLRHILTSPYKTMIDDVYILWLLAFFLKYARHQRVEFNYIRGVFSTDLFGFLVYEAVVNSEELVITQKNKQDTTKHLRRIHLTVGAMRELLQGLKLYSEDSSLKKIDVMYLENLQRDLASSSDLPQMFLLLIRNFQMHTHTLKFLQDVIITNHLLLLLIDLWRTSGLSKKEFHMLDHIKQFATTEVMQKYGRLLENFEYNNAIVNNCIFTMMHHIAGDCEKPTALLQVQILRTFLEILDGNTPLTQEKSDLIEFILHKFMVEAENNPFSCALQLFGEMPVKLEKRIAEEGDIDDNVEEEEEEDDSTEEMKKEKDILLMLYTELMGEPGALGAISSKLEEFGIKKTEEQISKDLKEFDWLTDENNTKESEVSESAKVKGESPAKSLNVSKKDERSSESDMDQGPPSSSPEDLNNLDDAEIVAHCIKKLKESSGEVHLKWLQQQFCDVAYAKYAMSLSSFDKKEPEGFVARLHVVQNKSVPLMLYSEEQEQLMHNPYFITLLQFLGLHMPEDVGLVFPRIPHFWTVQYLIDKASQIGDLTKDQLKFDPVKLKERKEMTEIPLPFKVEKMDDITFEKMRKIPESVWMNMIQQYNKNSGNSGKSGVSKHPADTPSRAMPRIVPFSQS